MATNVYVDAFNLYYGSLKGTPYRWLDRRRLLRSFAAQGSDQPHPLLHRHRPKPRTGQRRVAFEHRAFTVTAAVTLVRPEDDGDLHLVLRSGPFHMIAEAPSFACTGRALPRLRRAMQAARSRIRLCARARLTGVAFFDFDHGQTGVAPNVIELHPILGFHCLA